MGRRLKKIKDFFELAADYGLCLYILLILAVLPFYFTDGFSRIGTNKALFFRAVNVNLGRILLFLGGTVLLLKLVSALCSRHRKEKEQEDNAAPGIFSVTDVFMSVYGIGLLASYFFSDYRETALLGAPGWFMGFFTQMAFVAIYFFISRLWKPRKWMLYLVFPVSAVIFLLGYLDRFGIHILPMESRIGTFISTIGNINWYCGYVVSVFFGGVIFLWKGEFTKPLPKRLLMAYTLLGFATLMTQGSESGVVAAGVVLLVLFCMSVESADKMMSFWEIMTLFSGACLFSFLFRFAVGDGFSAVDGRALELVTTGGFPIIVTIVSVLILVWVQRSRKMGAYRDKLFRMAAIVLVSVSTGAVLLVLLLALVNTIKPGSIGILSEYSLFTFSRDWGSHRGATWGAAFRCFWEQGFLHKMVGVGPDAMAAYMYSDGSEGLRILLEECFGEATLTNAHNEWLTVLVDLGILGLVGFVGTMVSAMVRFLRKGKQNVLLCAIGFCLIAYTVNNMFSFQQTMNGATMFVLLGMGAAFDREGERH